MDQALQRETEQLEKSWKQHPPTWLKDYLVEGVEDPRLNLQSILARHFLVCEIWGGRFEALQHQEYRFAAALNWLSRVAGPGWQEEDSAGLLKALRRGSDNLEGTLIPAFLPRLFAALPISASGVEIPNYLETLLTDPLMQSGRIDLARQPELDLFEGLWRRALAAEGEPPARLSVLEPACGSANDYRFLHAYGLAPCLDYAGFDLCPANVQNARNLFPSVRFQVGNVFEIAAADRSFDLCVFQDLVEHLSPAGIETAVGEICRVTRRAICAGFFQMDEIPRHLVRPVDDYHWNLLSRPGMAEMFACHGFGARSIHIGAFLARAVGCPETHNPLACTFWLHRLRPEATVRNSLDETAVTG